MTQSQNCNRLAIFLDPEIRVDMFYRPAPRNILALHIYKRLYLPLAMCPGNQLASGRLEKGNCFLNPFIALSIACMVHGASTASIHELNISCMADK